MDNRKRQKKQHSRDYQMLLDHIPGGVQQCLDDEFFTMIEVNRGFLELFGYTRKELKGQFNDHYIKMIYPEDRLYVKEEVSGRLARGGKLTLQYRVCCKDGSFKWIMDNAQRICGEDGEEDQILCILTDISEIRESREELRHTMERHQMILDQGTDIIFEWDLLKDTISYSTNWEKTFGCISRYDGHDNQERFLCRVHPEDAPVLREMMDSIAAGKPFAAVEIRIQNAEGQFIWCRVRAADQYDDKGKPLNVVGIITDIDEEKRMIDDLRRRAERDALTGLYNREETERRIRRYLEDRPGEICALYMIDADDFKQINDSQGHIFGDAVLAELAAGMKRLTRQTDVVGRIGGDEFAIFIKDIPSREVAARKAEQLTHMFRNLFHEDRQLLEVSCSIGVSMYPDNGEDFQTLYHSADMALYQAKSQGKNQFVLLDAEHAVPVNMSGYSSLGAAIDSDVRHQDLPESLVNYVFQVLYDTKDIQNSIQLILEIVGKRFDVSRAYIFESSDDGKYANNTYEWCNQGITPEKDHLQRLPYAAIAGYKEMFSENTVFYCRDIYSLNPELIRLLEPQGVRSLLHCAIVDRNGFCGIVGFDECTGMRMWTREEIGILSLVSQLITTFLLKKRAMERDEQVTLQLNTILDTQDAYIYAIERSTYKLLYLNHKTRKLDPNAETGMTCYQAFFGRDLPCETCPLSHGTGEIYNPQYDVWTKVRVSPMKWGSIDAYLLSCFDITEYKRIQGQNPAAEDGPVK